jgi:hypothetical protein
MDGLSIPMTLACYDQYTETLRPQLNLTNGNLIILVPGRCGLFASLEIIPGMPLSQLTYKLYEPIRNYPLNQVYISSCVYDFHNQIIFYTIKTFNTPGAFLHSFAVDRWAPNSGFLQLDLAESEAILVLGNEKDGPTITKYLFVIASGSNKIQRFTVDGNNTFAPRALAVITPSINRISSAYYVFPYIYFVTYEPDAKVVRIPKTSFCNNWCGDFGFCVQGVCLCQEGYSFDTTDPERPCKLDAVVNAELLERQSQGAAAALGVLFAFSFVAAIAGWFLWWKARKSSVGGSNQPLRA